LPGVFVNAGRRAQLGSGGAPSFLHSSVRTINS
jgi:hypothetical protein